jgi:ABC-2 type transport system ATP-binding protein
MSEIVLEVKNLVKEYGTFRAVDGISFAVPRGKVIGFLGPNGAGKTTTIQMLLGITLPSAGAISYFGKDFTTHKEWCLQKINYASAFNTLLGRLSVWENLMVYATLYRVPHPKKKITDLIEHLQAGEFVHKRYWDISAGQKTRANLIKAFINDPELILMDEPTASLDPDIADKILTLIEDLKREKQMTVLFTSHDMEEVTRICDEVIFLDHGKIVAQDTPVNLTKRIRTATLRLMFSTKKSQIETFLVEGKYSFEFEGGNRVSIKTEEEQIPKILFGMGKENIYITDIEVAKPGLEDVFLQIARGDTYVT